MGLKGQFLHPLVFLFGLAAVSLLALLLVPPIPQSQIYHGFADQRMLFRHSEFLERGVPTCRSSSSARRACGTFAFTCGAHFSFWVFS